MRLVDHDCRIVHVLEHVVAVQRVECVVTEREPARVGPQQMHSGLIALRVDFEVDARDRCTRRTRDVIRFGAVAAAHDEHVLRVAPRSRSNPEKNSASESKLTE